jgi:putative ABC transport system ATP-binding protein
MSDAVLAVEDLGKSYRTSAGALTVLEAVSFTVARGECVAVTGPSGSGKSTLLGLIAGLDSPSSGRILVEGQDLAAMGESALALFRGRRMGFIFQSYRLLPTLTAEENVRVPLELARHGDAAGTARRWLERVGLGGRASHLPARLSGGEQQRVALARALAPQPALIFADEPTGNLDSRTGDEMTELLFTAVREQGATLLLVTHEEQLAARAGRVLVMRDGRLAGDRRGSEARRGADEGRAAGTGRA